MTISPDAVRTSIASAVVVISAPLGCLIGLAYGMWPVWKARRKLRRIKASLAKMKGRNAVVIHPPAVARVPWGKQDDFMERFFEMAGRIAPDPSMMSHLPTDVRLSIMRQSGEGKVTVKIGDVVSHFDGGVSNVVIDPPNARTPFTRDEEVPDDRIHPDAQDRTLGLGR